MSEPPQEEADRKKYRHRKSKIRRRTGKADPPPVPWQRLAITFAIIAVLAVLGLLACLLTCGDTAP